MSIEINNESDLELPTERVLAMLLHHFERLKLSQRVELSVMFINEQPMEELHVKWLDEPGPTDVLSFPMDELRPGDVETEGVLGDIVICPQVARLQADAAGHGEMDEIMLLATHGLLHLLGFDHSEPEQEAEMFGLQRELLDSYQAEELS
jgi:probable rRNA maturation factor